MTYARDMFIEAFTSRFASPTEMLSYMIDHGIIFEKTIEKWAILQSYPVLRTELSKCDAIRTIQKESRLAEVTIRSILNKEQGSFRLKK